MILEEPDGNSRYPFTKAAGLLGRNEDVLWFEDGKGRREFLHPLAVEGICIDGLRDYQFRQISEDAFEVLAEISSTASEKVIRSEIRTQVQKVLAAKNLNFVKFYIKFIDEILPDIQTGKKRLIIKDLDQTKGDYDEKYTA